MARAPSALLASPRRACPRRGAGPRRRRRPRRRPGRRRAGPHERRRVHALRRRRGPARGPARRPGGGERHLCHRLVPAAGHRRPALHRRRRRRTTRAGSTSPPARSTAPVVACLSAPWRHDVLRLRVAPPDLHGEGGARPGSPPWALTLSSGLRCLAVQGASPRAHGRRLRYRCPGPRFLFGAPDTRRATWRIHLARSAGGAHQRPVTIRRAWVGGPAGTPAG